MAQYVNCTPVVKGLGLDLGPHPPQCSHTSLSHTVPVSPSELPCSPLYHTSNSCSYYTHFHVAHNSLTWLTTYNPFLFLHIHPCTHRAMSLEPIL